MKLKRISLLLLRTSKMPGSLQLLAQVAEQPRRGRPPGSKTGGRPPGSGTRNRPPSGGSGRAQSRGYVGQTNYYDSESEEEQESEDENPDSAELELAYIAKAKLPKILISGPITALNQDADGCCVLHVY